MAWCYPHRTGCEEPLCKANGPMLRLEEGEQPLLCTDQESLDGGASRENSVAEQRSNGSHLAPLCETVQEDWIGGEGSGGGAGGEATDSPPSHPSPSEAEEDLAEGAVDEGYGSLAGASLSTSSADDEVVVDGVGDTEVVFVREGVAIRPTRSNRILGRLSLIKQHGVLFLAWLPYTPGTLLAGGGYQPSGDAGSMMSYAIHPVALSEVKAMHKSAPPLGCQVATITLFNGISLPPLYFQHGGLKLFLSALRQHAHLVRSADDPQTYLVNDIADPLQRSLHSLELTDVLLGAPPPGASSTFAPHTGPFAGWQPGRPGEGEAPLRAQLLDLVDRLQRFTQNAKDTASSFFAGGSMLLGSVPAASAAGGGTGEEEEEGEGAAGATEGAAAATEVGARSAEEEGRESLDEAGAAGEQRRQSSLGATTSTEVGVFELIERCAGSTAAAAVAGRTAPRPPPVSLEELGTFFDPEGRLLHEASFRQRVFDGGLEPDARPEAWCLLLGVHPLASTQAEREARRAAQRLRYQQLRAQWRSIAPDQAARFAKWRERKTRVDKDVRRTDRSHRFYARERGQSQAMLRNILLSYVMHNFDLGYCQGMSDLLSPILYVVRSALPEGQLPEAQQAEVEADAFWCFAALMERVEANFSSDGAGMQAQLAALRRLLQLLDPPLYAFLQERDAINLYCCYRMILCLFKREFSFEEVLRLWEALWACPASRQLHLYMALAVLEHQRRRILGDPSLDFDQLLKMCVELSGRIDLETSLRDALLLVNFAGQAGAECVAGLP